MKHLRTIIVCLPVVFAMTLASYSQPFIRVRKADFFRDAPGFREAWAHIKLGDRYFREGPGSIPLALEAYTKASGFNAYCPSLNYKIGTAYLFSDRKWEAQRYLDMAWEFNPAVTGDIQFYRGRAFHYNMLFSEALDSYKAYLDSLPEKGVKKMGPVVEKLMDECRAGMELIKDTLRVQVENIGAAINSPYDDYNTVLSSRSARMYFTSRRPFKGNMRLNPVDNKYNEDIYVSYYDGGVWKTAEVVGAPLNTSGNEAALHLSKDDQQLLIYYGRKKNGDLYMSEFRKGKWQAPSPMPGMFNSRSRETTVSLSADMKEMFFVSASERESMGGTDIFYSVQGKNDHWSRPVHLGPEINTEYDEEGVHVSSGGDTLYFSSKGHNSMGGYDVFMSERINGQWSQARNLGFPINTPDDDLFYTTSNDTAVAYLSSTRKDGLGWMDIFRLTCLPPPVIEPEVMIVELPPPPDIDTVVVVVRDTVQIEEPKPIDTSVSLLGTVFEEGTSNPVMAKIELIDVERNQVVSTSLSDRQNGSFRLRLENRKNYGVEITAQGYMVYLDIVEVPVDLGKTEVLKNFFLKKVKVGEKVVLKNIFFDTNKATLKPESYTELNNVFKLLTTNPTLRIEISGHTDNVGSAQLNNTLSQARAKAVVDYLVVNGIDPSRLEYKGYGFMQPIASNDSPAGRAQNRRVEFKILSE